jgi:hypothetical protein
MGTPVFTGSTVSVQLTEPARARAIDALYATGHWLLSRDRTGDAAAVFGGMAALAPRDERAWLALGACHEAFDQPDLALEMYGTGQSLSRPGVRLRLARARVLSGLGRDDEACVAREDAEAVAEALGDERLLALVRAERGTT